LEPKTHNIFLLLGRETWFQANQPRKYGKWCDFGGKIDDDETIQGGTAREFCEESLCVVRMNNNSSTDHEIYQRQVENMLIRRQYFFRFVLFKPSIFGPPQKKVYFVRQVPWQPDVPDRFRQARSNISNRDPTTYTDSPPKHHIGILDDNTTDPHCMEKHCVSWWSIDRLSEVVRNNGRYRQHFFRKSFMPCLRLLVSKFQEYYQ
jgi:hypothetical protein